MANSRKVIWTVQMSGTTTSDTTAIREQIDSTESSGLTCEPVQAEHGSIATGVTKALFPASLVGLSKNVEFMIEFSYDSNVALASREVSVNPDGIAAAIKARRFYAGKASSTLTVLNSTGQDVSYQLFIFVQTA
jgi:hypothetical protein